MDEYTLHTAITLTKKELLSYGSQYYLETVCETLMQQISDHFLDLISEKLKDEENNFQFILTVKRLDNND